MSTLAQRATATTVQQRDEQPTVGQLINRLIPEMARALPAGMSADRMARIALTVVRKTPQLASCSPESFAGALLTAAQLGLEFGAANEAYLVPHKREATLIIGYQGLCKLFYQHPAARHLDAQAVHERDVFEFEYGLHPRLVHRPTFGERGPVIAYYAVASLASGASSFVVLTPEEVKDLRQGKVGPSGQIKDPQHWMERKTVLRQLLKTMPKSAEMVRALAVDETATSSRSFDVALATAPAQGALGQAPPGVDTATGALDDAYDGAHYDDPVHLGELAGDDAADRAGA